MPIRENLCRAGVAIVKHLFGMPTNTIQTNYIRIVRFSAYRICRMRIVRINQDNSYPNCFFCGQKNFRSDAMPDMAHGHKKTPRLAGLMWCGVFSQVMVPRSCIDLAQDKIFPAARCHSLSSVSMAMSSQTIMVMDRRSIKPRPSVMWSYIIFSLISFISSFSIFCFVYSTIPRDLCLIYFSSDLVCIQHNRENFTSK